MRIEKSGAPNEGVPQGVYVLCWKGSVVKLLEKGGLACAERNTFGLTVIGN